MARKRQHGDEAAGTCSLPANALTSIMSVDCGRWKFVMRPPTTRNCEPGERKYLVAPEWASTLPILGAMLEGAHSRSSRRDDTPRPSRSLD